MNITDNVIRKAFVNLELFLQKVAALDIFEVLIFNYKIKFGLLDPLTVNFLAIVTELCEELSILLKDSDHVKGNSEKLPASEEVNLNSKSIPIKKEEIRPDIPIVLSFCGDGIDDKSLELVDIPLANDVEPQECMQNCESGSIVKAVVTLSEDQNGECPAQIDNNPNSTDDAELLVKSEKSSEINIQPANHDQNKSNACRFCCRKFPSTTKLIGHLAKCSKAKTKNSNEKYSHKCNQCDLTFSSLKLLNCHLSQIHDKNDTTEVSPEDSMLYRVVEVQSLPENLPFYCCKTCLYVYKTPMEFEAHSCKEVSDVLNTESEGYVGDYFYMLGKYLISNPDLLAQMRKFRCGICCEEYRSLERMMYHLMRCTQGPYLCELCRDEFASKRELNRHKKKAHRDTNCFFCDECGLTFKLRASLQKHKVNRHERRADTTCEQCNLTFSKRIQLTNHMIREHQVERKFLCQVCGNKFSTHSSLMAHLSTHSEPFKFACSFCNKKFRQKEKLKFHTRIHTGERPHLCPTCGKGFIRKSKLDEHMRRHRGEKQYRCKMCSKCYASSWDLKLHMRKQHSEENTSVNVKSTALTASETLMSETEPDDPVEVNPGPATINTISNEETAELHDLPEETTLAHLRELPLAQPEPSIVDPLAPNSGKILVQLEPPQVPSTLLHPTNDGVGPRLLLQLSQGGDASPRILVQLDGNQVAPAGQATLLPSTILTVTDTLQLTPVVEDLNLNLGNVPTQYLQLASASGSAGGADNNATGSTATTSAIPVHIQLPVSAVPVPATAISQAASNGTTFGLQPVPVQAVFTPAGFNVNSITY